MENNKDIHPIFYEHSSQKSILVPWNPDDSKPKEGEEPKVGYATSIFSIAKEAGLKYINVISPNFHNFVEMQKNGEKMKIPLRFGLEMWVTDNIENTEQSTANESKVIIWLKNPAAYRDAIKLYSKVYTNPNNKYYHFRGSWNILKEMWTDNLMLSLPFFDSFIARNTLNHNSSIIPNFPCKPAFQREVNSQIPFAGLIDAAIDEYNKDREYEEIKTKTIMYKDYQDIKPYIVYRAIGTRGNYGAPNLDFMCSDTFCWEDYKELTK